VGVVLGDLAVGNHGRGVEDVEALDAADGLGRFLQRLLRGVAPGVGGDTHQIDGLDHRHTGSLAVRLEGFGHETSWLYR
jgi:hypothetical protein